MVIKLTPCLVVCLAIMTGIKGDTIMRMENEENFMEKMIMKDVTNLLEDIPQLRMKRDTVCQPLKKESKNCIDE